MKLINIFLLFIAFCFVGCQNNTKINNLDQRIIELEDKVNTLEATIDELNHKIDDLETQTDDNEGAISDLESNLNNIISQ